MCGRYVIEPDDEEHFFENFGVDLSDELFPRGIVSYNIAPTQSVPVLRHFEGEPEVVPMQWGLIPSWAKDRAMASKMINARSETVHEKPSFRTAYQRRRCVVPASGWYEWQTQSGRTQKTPYYFKRGDSEVIAFGGLWEEWTDSDTGEVLNSCTILTHEAGEEMLPFHHRSPLVLNEDGRKQWLSRDYRPQDLAELCEISCRTVFAPREVSRDVGKVANNSPELLKAAAQRELF